MPDLPDINPDQTTAPEAGMEPAPQTRPLPPTAEPERRGRRRFRSRRNLADRGVDLLITAINVASAVAAAILALHIVFVIFTTNPNNTIVSTVRHWATWLAWDFKDVFVPDNHKVAVLVNFGLAAIVYLIVARLLIGVIRRATSLLGP